MGKITGFMEFPRVAEQYAPVTERLKHYREFVLTLDQDSAKQQTARCMDCGIPFCNNGCPVHNVIPDWNDLIYHQKLDQAIELLHSTNNFPEFTGRICPAPCETACTLGIHEDPVGIKSVERYIVDSAWDNQLIKPQPATRSTGKKIAIVGSGPAGLACAQQLVRVGHAVTVYEKNDRVGGLLRYGIPDFKLDKAILDRRLTQLKNEGVEFVCNTLVSSQGKDDLSAHFAVECAIKQHLSFDTLAQNFDAIVLAGGSENARDLTVPARELDGVHFAMNYLSQQNRLNAGDQVANAINARGKHVVVIGGGDTGSDCVGTANRQGAKSVTQFELMPMPPEKENKALVWPYWPIKLRTSSSHAEGCERDFAIATKRFEGQDGKLQQLIAARLDWRDGKMQEIADSEFSVPADLVFLAMGFAAPVKELFAKSKIELDARGNLQASTDEGIKAYQTSRPKFFAAGDMRRGQSLVVWAIQEGRQCAQSVDRFLQEGQTSLPR